MMVIKRLNDYMVQNLESIENIAMDAPHFSKNEDILIKERPYAW